MIVLILMGLLPVILGCQDRQETSGSNETASINQYGGVYHKALHHDPPTLDPALATGLYDESLMPQIFDGLVQFDTNLNVIPSVAKSWEATHDGLVWTFYLRQDVTFHNGRKVTAEDFVYSFTRLIAPQTKSPRTWLFRRVKGAAAFRDGKADTIDGLRALEPYTLQITLSEPDAPFIRMLGVAQAKVVPREEVERQNMAFGRHPVGTGPFRFVDWTPGKAITLQANEAYFEGRPFLDQVSYRIFPGGDREAILAAFEKGEVYDAELSLPERHRLIGDSRFQLFRRPVLATLFLWLNAQEGPLSHLKVRQAINLAINREFIYHEVRQKRDVLARGILPPGMPGYNPELSSYAYNPERARLLLAEAGYPDGKGLAPIELWNSATPDLVRAENAAIKRDLQQIGITIELKTAKNWKHFKTKILGKLPGAIYRSSWHSDFPDPDYFLFLLFHSGSANNYSHYSNSEVDRLLAQAQIEVDYLHRLELYRKAEQIIIADVPSINLVHYAFEHLFQPYVRGITLNALGTHYIAMKEIWLDTTHHAYPKLATSK
jgi:peptide/nickel transport system substrate-binding protein/oligopeptide transport system substrate-binding protein